jgi:hypothetical protein
MSFSLQTYGHQPPYFKKKNYFFLFFALLQINTVLMFLDYFDTLILEIILKNIILNRNS